MKRFLSVVLLLSVLLGMLPFRSFAEEGALPAEEPASTVETGLPMEELASAEDEAALVPIRSNNRNDQSYILWTQPVYSYLYRDTEGQLVRMEVLKEEIIFETYDSALQIIQRRSMPFELPIFGGFYEGEEHFFLIFGQKNEQELETVETFRTVKYDKQWNRLGACSLYGSGTAAPFHFCLARMTEYKGMLYVATGRLLYGGHQSNYNFSIRIADMVMTDEQSGILNTTNGMVSHSWNQFVDIDGDRLVTLNHGETYPTAAIIIKYDLPAGQETFINTNCTNVHALDFFDDNSHLNATGASLGGFEVTDRCYLVAGNSICEDGGTQRNIFVSACTKTEGSLADSQVTLRWFTSYPEGQEAVNVSTPHLVAAGENRYVLLWTEGDILKHTLLNGDGEQISPIYESEGCLSDCKPVYLDDRILWYYTIGGEPIFLYIHMEQPEQVVNTHVHNRVFRCTENPSTSRPGKAELLCLTCAEVEERTLPALNAADYIVEYTQMPTCTETGYAHFTYPFTEFGTLTFSATVGALGHEYEAGSCIRCGESCIVGGTLHDHGYLTWELNTETGVLVLSGDGPMKDTQSIPKYHDYSKYIRTVVITDGITHLGCRAFAGFEMLEAVQLPSHPISVGDYAFIRCPLLKNIDFSTVSSVGLYAFHECDSLKEVNLSDTLTSISEYGFARCDALETVALPSELQSLGIGAFAECIALKELVFEEGLIELCDKAFQGCTALESVRLPSSLEKLGVSAFEGCSALKELQFGMAPLEIGDYAFKDCTALTELSLPDGVTAVGAYAFQGCTALTRLTIGKNVATIASGAMAGCEALTDIQVSEENPHFSSDQQGLLYNKEKTQIIFAPSGIVNVVIPEGVEEILDSAFYDARKLESIRFPESLKGIGNYAFYGCTALKSLILPTGSKEIGNYAFYDCKRLKTLTLPSELTELGEYAFAGCSGLSGDLRVPEGVTEIKAYTFSGCEFSSIELPGVVRIGDCGFWGTKIQTFLFSEKLEEIGNVAFYEGKLKTIQLPEGLKHIGESAFARTALTEITLPQGLESIGREAFNSCKELKALHIPASVREIGEGVLLGSRNLLAVTVDPENVFYFADAQGALYSREPMELLFVPNCLTGEYTVLPGTTVVQPYVFSQSKLEEIVLPEGLKIIGEAGFNGCEALEKIVLPSSVEELHYIAFANCAALKEVTLSDSLSFMDEGCFQSCKALEKVDFRGKLTEVPQSAFSECSALMQVQFYPGLESFGSYAFYGCSKLKTLILPASFGSFGYRCLWNCVELEAIYMCGPYFVTNTYDIDEYGVKRLHNAFKEMKYKDPITFQEALLPKLKVYYVEGLAQWDVVVADWPDFPFFKHEHTNMYQVSDANCTQGNMYTVDCEICGIMGPEPYDEPLGHDYIGTITTEPTEEQCGLLTVKCSRCPFTVEEELPVLSDRSYDITRVYPSCTKEGYVKYTWKNTEYGTYAVYEYEPPVPHSYKSQRVAPTCTEKGYTIYTCYNCKDSYIDNEIPARGHVNTLTRTVPPTCTEEGYSVYTCRYCQTESQGDSVPPTGHSYESSVVQPNCTQPGCSTYVCSVCQDTYTEELPATGHSYAEEIIAPTCTEEGYTLHTCAACGDSYKDSTIPAAGHAYEEKLFPPTCGSDGFTLHICTVCGHYYKDNIVPAPGHQFIAETVDPTCTEDGYTLYSCAVCGYHYKDNVTSAVGHTYESVVTEPSCTEGGYTTHSCTVCGDTYEDTVVPAKGHDYVTIVTEPTCTEGGYSTLSCTVCGITIREGELAPLGHAYTGVLTAPSCTEGGFTTFTCNRCQDTYTGEETEAVGHSWGQWTITLPPTTTAEGVESRVCSRCESKEQRSIPVVVNPFGDVSEEVYYFAPVLWAVENQITNGTGEGSFSPDRDCMRAQIVTFLWRAMGSPEPQNTENSFTDVKLGAYYEKAVLWAVEQGITNGTSKGKFSPEATCTRAQVATFLWRAMGCPEPLDFRNPFTDVDTGAYYGKAVLWAVEQGITNGTGNGRFSPDKTCTRGQIVTFLYRAMQLKTRIDTEFL